MNKFKSFVGTPNRIEVLDSFHLSAIDYSDAASLVKHLNDKAFYDFTCSIPHPYTLADANAFVTNVISFEKKNNVQRDWAIRDKTGAQIGGIGLLFNHGMKSHRSEFGYWIGKSFWNLGIMTEVVKIFSEYVFKSTMISRLEAMVFDGNKASQRVLEKAGFIHEGFLRGAYLKEDHHVDAHLYAKLDPDKMTF